MWGGSQLQNGCQSVWKRERNSETQSWLKLLLLAVDKRGHPQLSLLGPAAGVPSLVLSSSYVSHTLHRGHLKVKQWSYAPCFSVNVSNVSVQLHLEPESELSSGLLQLSSLCERGVSERRSGELQSSGYCCADYVCVFSSGWGQRSERRERRTCCSGACKFVLVLAAGFCLLILIKKKNDFHVNSSSELVSF